MLRHPESARARPRAPLGRFRCGLRTASLVLGLALALARSTGAQSSEGDDEPEVPRARKTSSLLGRFGLEPSRRLLDDTSAETRIRGIQRLARIGTPAALEALVEWSRKRASSTSAREWLALVRGLRTHLDHAPSRQLLASLMVQPVSARAAPVDDPLRVLVRDGAALALAHDGSDASLGVLGRALRSDGAPAEAAFRALVAHPARRIEPIVGAPGEPTALLARWLEQSGAPGSEERLRQIVRTGSASARAEAALALTRLGDGETVELAERWLGLGRAELERAGLEILALREDARALRPLAERIERAPLDDELARITLLFPDARLEPALRARLERGDGRDAPWLWLALGRMNSERAAATAARSLTTSEALYGAHALSLMPGSAGTRALERALAQTPGNAAALRAALARRYLHDDDVAGLAQRLTRLEAGKDERLRALAAWGRSLLEPSAARAALDSNDEARVLGVAHNVLLFDDALAVHMAAAMADARSERMRVALGASLVRRRARDAVPTRELLDDVESRPALAPLALRALAERADEHLEPLIEQYLNGPDPLLRAHVARGLADSTDANARGRLIARYEVEPDATVRLAIVSALAGRPGLAVQRTLALAAALDASPEVRAAAREGARDDALGGRALCWLELEATRPEVALDTAALLVLGPGLAMPVFPDPDGMLIVAGARQERADLRFPPAR